MLTSPTNWIYMKLHEKTKSYYWKRRKKKFGNTFPNPTVGCVIAKNSKIISKAVTNKSGRPHAEEIALAKAGHKAKGASMYVTLEPCFHSSKDGSCTDQILRSGIKEICLELKVIIQKINPRLN